MMSNSCAIYARFSNLDHITADGISRSIANQIEILSRYALDNGFTIYKVYNDYNFSGKDFERPQIKELLSDAEAGKFSTIIVKDLSRFGRNYLDVGKYIDEVFPRLGLRFIAVDDHFDSSKSSDYLSIAVKNFMNDYYRKDIGKKIRRTFNVKGHKRTMASRHYGYDFNKGVITINEEEAKVIRRIYSDFLKGETPWKMVKIFASEKVLTPSASYEKRKFPDKYNAIPEEKRYKWKLESITNILRDRFFTGETINFKSSHNIKSSVDTNIVLKDDHPAIIDIDTFNEVQKKGVGRQHMEIVRENLRQMIYCEKCLSRSNYDRTKSCLAVNVTDDGMVNYVDYRCGVKYPADLMNHRIYDELIRKYHQIMEHREEYIQQVLLELQDDNGEAKLAQVKKEEAQKRIALLFESFVNGEITESVYQSEMAILRDSISTYSAFLKNFTGGGYKENEVRNKINRFLNLFYESEDIVNVIKANVDFVLYDPRCGSFKLVLKFETELGLRSKTMESLVKKDIIKGSEFDLDQMIVQILKVKPNLKIKQILEETKKTWNGFTYIMVKKAIQRLEHNGLVEMEGNSKLVDTYHIVGQEEDFDYKGMRLSRSEKEVYKLLYENPTLSYIELAEIRHLTESTIRATVISLRKKGAFEDKEHFRRDFVPDGSWTSIFEERKSIDSEEFKQFVLSNPKMSRRTIATQFGITEGESRMLLKKCGFVRPDKWGSWILKEK